MDEKKRKRDFQRLYDLAGKRAAKRLDKKMKDPQFLPEGTPDQMRGSLQRKIYNKKANKYEKNTGFFSSPGEGPRYQVSNDTRKRVKKK
jgi:hypothetical protein